MSLIGLSWLQLLGIGAALSAAVVIIYLLKLKRRGLLVSSSMLWRQVLEQRPAESLIERLRWWFSLLLQVAFALLVITAIAQPKLGSQSRNERWTVLLLDASASMQARSPEDRGRTRFELARAAAGDLINNLSGAESVMLVRLGGENETLSRFTPEQYQLEAALERAEPTEGPADLARALRLANEALAGKPNPRIVLISDGGVSPELLAASRVRPALVRVGAPADNVGVTAISVRKPYVDLPDYQLFVEVSNFGRTARSLNIQIYQGEELIDTRPLEVPARGTAQKVFSDFALSGGPLRVELAAEDALALDDRAYAYLPPARRQKGLLVTDGNVFLESALTADPTLELKKVRPAQFDGRAEVDFVVFDGAAPRYAGPAHALYLNPRGESSPIEVVGTLGGGAVGEFNGQHPLLRYISFKDLVVKNVPRLKAAPGDLVLARAGSDPVVVAREEAGRRIVALAFDTALAESADLPLRAAFPMLLANVRHWFASERSAEAMLALVGQPVRLAAEAVVAAEATVRGPDATETAVPAGGSFAPMRVGFYETRSGTGSQVLAVNLVSAAESDLVPSDRLGQVTDKLDSHKGSWTGRPLWFYLVLVGLALATLEWFTYQRRITV